MNVALSRAKHMQILVGNFTEWMQARADGHKSLKRNGANQYLGMLLDSLCTKSSATPYKVIAREDFEAGLKGTNIEKSTFKDKIRVKPSKKFTHAFESTDERWAEKMTLAKRPKIEESGSVGEQQDEDKKASVQNLGEKAKRGTRGGKKNRRGSNYGKGGGGGGRA